MKITYLIFFAVTLLLKNPKKIDHEDFSHYILKGKINADTGTMILELIGGEDYNLHKQNFNEVKVLKGIFSFSGTLITNPQGFRLIFKEGPTLRYISQIFFLEPRTNLVVCNIDSVWEIPSITNSSMFEFRNNFLKNDNLVPGNDNIDSIVLKYVKKNPHSYIGLWNLINEFSSGYKPIYDSTYNFFSKQIKQATVGKVLGAKIKLARTTSTGNPFPKLYLFDINKKKYSVIEIGKENQYTLIDFWFSYCIPCISQFDSFKESYKIHKKKGFNIISISTDQKKDQMNLLNVIEKYSLPWAQYWDINQKDASRLSINSFPTNFLLDSNGKIITKNIEPKQLAEFLALRLP